MNLNPFSRLRKRRPSVSHPLGDEAPPTRGPLGPISMSQGGIDLLPLPVALMDEERRILWANEAFIEMTGPISASPFCYHALKDRASPCPDCPLHIVFQEGRTQRWEETFRTPNQPEVHFLLHAAPFEPDSSGRKRAIVCASELGELSRRLKQLELSQREYKALFHGVPCYISIQDRDLTIIKTNRFMEKAFGRAVGRKCYRIYKRRSSPCDPCPVLRTFQDARVYSSEETVLLASGREARTIVYTSPIYDLTGRVFAVMEMSTDITDVKQLQHELSTLGQALGVMAHTIKNILNGLQGGAYVVQSGLRRGDPQLAQQGWEMVHEGVELVGQLVKDILYLSKDRTPEYQKVDPGQILHQVWTLFQKRADDLGVELVLEMDDVRPCPLLLDPKGIHSALANLVTNALEACTEDSSKTSHRIVLRLRDYGKEGIGLEVEDNGPGVPLHLQTKLFREAFSTKGSRGTGLGAVTTRKIVETHGGTLRWRSSPGDGMWVEIRLPRRAEPPAIAKGEKVGPFQDPSPDSHCLLSRPERSHAGASPSC